MAVGTVGSNLQTSATQVQTQTPAVLKSDVVLSSTPAAMQNGKTYYHRVPGARTHMADGTEIVFAGGFFATEDPAVQEFLDAIADRPASGVFTQKTTDDSISKFEKKEAEEIKKEAKVD